MQSTREHPDHIVRLRFARHFKRKIFSRAFVQHHQYLDRPAIRGPVENKIHAPHLVLAYRLLAENARLCGSNSSPFPAGLSHFQTFFSPEVTKWFVIYTPTLTTQQVLHVPLATARMLARECVQPRCEAYSACVLDTSSALHAAMLSNHTTRSALRDGEDVCDVWDGPTPERRA